MPGEAAIEDADVRIYLGDALEQLERMRSESVQCIVTSPPFWGLRDYGHDGQIGLEETPEEWCAKLVAVMRAARRVLRSDGVCWIEVGDTYAGGGGYSPGSPSNVARQEARANGVGFDGAFAVRDESHYEARKSSRTLGGVKPKDLVGAPWMLAFALRADGWYLRSDTIWARPNPMPESVTDRPSKAHSYVFLLSKSPRYFYDADAIREDAKWTRANDPAWNDARRARVQQQGAGMRHAEAGGFAGWSHEQGANARSVWSIPTEPTPFAHFATFPRALVERCIKAGTSEHGACSECGAPWRRLVEVDNNPHPGSSHNHADDLGMGGAQVRHDGKAAGSIMRERSQSIVRRQVGWAPTCDCEDAGVVPCVVLDPFMGSGTTALVARKMGRHAVGVELSPEYLEIARERLAQQSLFIEEANR